jgi:hypothetical protein
MSELYNQSAFSSYRIPTVQYSPLLKHCQLNYAFLLSNAFQPFRRPFLSIIAAGIQYTGSRSTKPGWPKMDSPMCETPLAMALTVKQMASTMHKYNNDSNNASQQWPKPEAQFGLTGHPEQCMKYVYHISWSICNSTSFWILFKKSERSEKKKGPLLKFGP